MPSIPFLSTYSRREWIQMAILFCAFIASAQLGRFLFSAPAVIQPAAGVALAGLVLWGISLWPAILAGMLMNTLIAGAAPIAALGGIAGQTLHAVIGVYVLRRFNFDPVFRRVRDMFAFMFVALFASMIVPSLGFIGIYLNNFFVDPDVPYRTTWLAWWAGIMIGDLVLASTLIRWFAKRNFSRTRVEWIEISAALVSLCVLSYFIYWTDSSQTIRNIIILLYLVPFIWFALRLGMRFTLLAFLLTTMTALTGTLYGHAPATTPLPQRIITLEFFIATLAVIFYLFVSVMEERLRAARQLQAQLTRVGSLLKESKREDRAKSEFIAVFAHELRNPLAPIVSATDLLKLRFGAHPDIAPIIDTLENRTSTIVHLLDDLLDLARISQGKLRLRKETAALCDIVRRSALSIESQFKSKNQTISIETPATPIRTSVDPVRIEQIVNNLLSNASKFSPEGSRIELSVRQDTKSAEIRVRDYGVGIEKGMTQKIFEPFLQVETEMRNSGLGIGLSLTKKLVEEHGGTITAKSDGEGKGSEFIVVLPFREETLIMSPLQTMEPVIQKTPLKVLVVDDNEAAAKGLATLLQHVGNTVEIAYSGKEAIDKSNLFKPEVIVLDIGLPDMSGYDVAEELRKAGYGGRIIALTGYGQDEDKKKAEAAGFDHHLTKPVGIADLQAVLMPQAA